MAEQSHTPGPRAKVRVHLTNPESGYESETEATVSVADWTVIDAVLCGFGQTYAAAPELLEAAKYAEERFGMWKAQTAEQENALSALRAAISKATGGAQ